MLFMGSRITKQKAFDLIKEEKIVFLNSIEIFHVKK